MKILCDLHHEQLYESLRILFEDRLGWEMFRPIGVNWYTEGFWKVHDAIDTAQQYLAIGDSEPLDTHGRPVTESHGQGAWINRDAAPVTSGLYRVGKHKAITLERAKETPWDAVLSSMPVHFNLYENFRRQFCPKAYHIFQQGNMWSPPDGVRNMLNSTGVNPPPGVNHVRYHQEFSLTEFSPGPCKNPRSVLNLMHYQQPRYQQEFDLLASVLEPRGWKFTNHGAGNRDGSCPTPMLPQTIRDHGFLWHNKAGGEGYGYNMHTAMAIGRPILCHRSLYQGMTASQLMVDGTCIDMDTYGRRVPGVDVIALASDLGYWASRHTEIAEGCVKHFRSVVDFDAEFASIKDFMGRLQ